MIESKEESTLKNKIDNLEETIDVKKIIKKFTAYWYYFILSISICWFIVFLYNRYTRAKYSVSATIEIRDDRNSQLGTENIFEGMEMFSIKTNLENEIAVIKSYSLAEATIKELSLGISYFQHGSIQTVNLYTKSPFVVKFDTAHLQLSGIRFSIYPIDDKTYTLKFQCKEQNTYDLIKNHKNNKTKVKSKIEYQEIHAFGELIKSDYFSFKIEKTDFFDSKTLESNNKFSFILHSLDKLSRKYIKILNIAPTNSESSILKLNIIGTTVNKNKDYLDKICELYIQRGLEEKNRMASNTIKFIENQILRTQDTLNLIADELEKFKAENPNLDVFEKDYGTFFQKQKTEGNISQYQIHLGYYRELLSYLQSSDGSENIISPTSMGISNPELNSLISEFITLNSKKKELELSTTESHPKYQSVLSQISYTRQSIIENLKNLISSTKSALRNEQNRVNQFEKDIESLPEAEKEYVKLKRKFMQSERIVDYLILKQHETTIAKEGTAADHKVLDYAYLENNGNPVSPKTKINYLLSLILGFGIPIFIISLRDFFNESIRSKSDLSKITDIPILGIVGHSETSNNLVVIDNPKSVLSESFRALRTNIQYLSSEKKNKVITITSSVGSEGKTFCTSNMGAILSLAGYKTIILGADLRKPRIHKDFNLDNSIGLSTFLINQCSYEELIHKSEIKNLNIIPSGPIPPNPSELLNNKKMKDLINKLKKEYEYIIIDTPPIGIVTDGVISMKYSDINLYVVRHNYTKRNMLNIINDLYSTKQIPNANIIINDFQISSSVYGYGYGYNYGYGYGDGYYEE